LIKSTIPPADKLLRIVRSSTKNIAMILLPLIDVSRIYRYPPHELQRIYLGSEQALYCIYFGELANFIEETELRINP